MIRKIEQTTVLVTGRFIRSHLVEALVERGRKIRILDNLSIGKRSNIATVSPQKSEVLLAMLLISKLRRRLLRTVSTSSMRLRSPVFLNLLIIPSKLGR